MEWDQPQRLLRRWGKDHAGSGIAKLECYVQAEATTDKERGGKRVGRQAEATIDEERKGVEG